MSADQNDMELRERLSLIESMIAEGRRGTESWGWSFLLWGVAYYVAAAWATLGRSAAAWPVTMILAAAITGIVGSRMKHGRPGTTIGRAMGAIWGGVGTSMFLVLMPLAFTGRYEPHVFIAIIGGMLGAANGISGIILRWKMQIACAVVWWASAIAACFVTADQTGYLFLGATFLCQIVFGIYAMVCDARRHGRQGAVHA